MAKADRAEGGEAATGTLAKSLRADGEPRPDRAEVAGWASEKLMRAVEREPLPANVGRLLAEAATRYPDRPALVFFEDDVTLTYGALAEGVARIAGGLATLGVGYGTVVAVMTHTAAPYPLTWLALASIGAVTVPVNPNYTSRELAYTIGDSGARFLVVEADLLRVLEGMERPLVPPERVVVVGEGGGRYAHHWQTLRDSAASAPAPTREPGLDDLMNIQYTSGTTGLPKGALLTHRFWLTFGKVGAAQFQNRIERLLIAQPFYYLDGQWLCLMAFYLGATAFVARRMSSQRFWDWIRRYRINYCNFPEIVSRAPERADDADNELIVVSCYSHRRENYAWYERRYGCLARQGFSMTELGCALYVPMEARAMTGTGTVGVPVAFREAMVADERGRPVPPRQEGELCVRGAGILLGYHDRPEATARAFHPGGWFRTGDVAMRDEDGWFYYLGRLKDMVRRSNENVSAVEVEGVLRGVEGVIEAAEVPVPDEDRGEEVKEYLRLAEGLTAAQVTPEVVLAHCARNLAPFKIPRYLEYVDDFPRTPSLKVRKSDLLAATPDLRQGTFDRTLGRWR